VCNEGFRVQKDMVKHKQLHRREWPLSCDMVI
jgi:hypothetical protein